MTVVARPDSSRSRRHEQHRERLARDTRNSVWHERGRANFAETTFAATRISADVDADSLTSEWFSPTADTMAWSGRRTVRRRT